MFSLDWASKWSLYQPDKPAIKEFESAREWTYAEWNQQGEKTAFFLQNNYQIQKGDRVAVLAEYSLEYCALFSAAQKIGCILVPLSYRLSPKELEYPLSDATPKLLITDNKFWHTIQSILLHESLPILVMESLYHVINDVQSQEPQLIEPELQFADPIFLLYTSGTTGLPKGVCYTHGMLFWNSINTAMTLKINAESRTVNCMPPFHTGGWNVLMTPILHHGGYMVLLKKFDPLVVLNALSSEKATIFMGVPTMLTMMAKEDSFQTIDLSSIFYIITGGESMPLAQIKCWHKRGIPIRQGYGMTEVGPNLTSLHQEDAERKIGSIGFPNFYVTVKIARLDGSKCQPNEPGELLLKGPMVTPGYWKNDKHLVNVLDTEGWFHTGDIAKMDEEGYLYIVDRLKDMFISGAENIYPAEIERILLKFPGVEEAAVIGIKDEKWGEVGKAFIVTQTHTQPVLEDLLIFCGRHLASYKIPKYIEFIEFLPRTSTGKVDKKQLKV